MVACTAGFYTNSMIHLLIHVYVGCMYVFYLIQLFEAICDSSAEETLRFPYQRPKYMDETWYYTINNASR